MFFMGEKDSLEGVSKESFWSQDRKKEGHMTMEFPSQENIMDEVTCPICMQLLTEPVSLNCGHNFCQGCITTNRPSVSYLGAGYCCPVCKNPYQPWNLRPNGQLASRVEEIREYSKRADQWQGGDHCEEHGESYDIFCKEDGKAICQLCVQEHQGHQMSPMEEVVKECQEKLIEGQNRLMQELLEAEELDADIKEERATWKNCVQTERERILKGFEEMRGILDREEQRELQKLEEDDVNVLDNLAVARDQLAVQRQYMCKLGSDLQRHMYESSLDTVQDVINDIRRSEIWTLKKPKIVSKSVKSSFRVPDLSGMLQIFKELTEVQSHWVDLKLIPLKTLSNIFISPDQRQVTVGNNCFFNNTYSCNISALDILGSRNFSSGKYYWEVDVTGKIAWILGVYSKTNKLNRTKSSGFVFKPDANYSNVYSRYRPTNGYWVIGLQNESEYSAFEDSSTSDPKILTLWMAFPPHRVGVFLDYEAGTVSFFNITNHGSLIYKFSRCHFSQTAYPYFNPCNCSAPMTLCRPSS
ncbi:E3 ubiquitin-protein ligase TRIM22-like isoform X2 [Saccopteryx bilineata]|uniref:E3 ubiquitin-protein ligase TRIM22-like isoform X2 n=1 Tax=Saccopteryx bilineata TaxID=59482 RepID=UPI00338EF79B